jgi:hypothetical protein
MQFLGFIPKLCALKTINNRRMPCKGQVRLSLKQRFEELVALLREVQRKQEATIRKCIEC